MFSVSGWKVTAPLKTQIPKNTSGSQSKPELTQAQARAARGKIDVADSDGEGAQVQEQNEKTRKRNLKRKRKNGKDITNVTAENVEGLYESVIEGKKPKRIRNKKKKPNPDESVEDTKDVESESKSELAKTSNGTTKTSRNKKPQAAQAIKPDEPKLTPLQASMRAKLTSARFRHLNEQLYTTPSATAFSLFSSEPDLFTEYHSGFRQQVSVWPENPLDAYISELRIRGGIKKFNSNDIKVGGSIWSSTPLPRTKGTCVVADIGCGDARLGSTLSGTKAGSKLNLKIHSFDLHSPSPMVTKADAANLPLGDGSSDIAIFCLALMGTNWLDFIDEAWRILRPNGELWIAEIKSRFGRPAINGKDGRSEGFTKGGIGTHRSNVPSLLKKDRERQEAQDEAELAEKVDVLDSTGKSTSTEKSDVGSFITALRRRGFALAGTEKESIDMSNKMFVKIRFIKAAMAIKGKNAIIDDGLALDDTREGKRFGDRQPKKKMKYLEDITTIGLKDEDEGRILKPCVYKLR